MKDSGPILLATLLGLLPMASGSAPADDALAADATFAARAAEIGHHGAFIEYLAADAVLFRPEAVQGQDWLATHEPAGGRLEWAPAAAAAACGGAFAITSGPWRYTSVDGGEPVAGHYLSVWRLDAQSQWRVVLDHGVDHGGDTPAGQLQAAFTRPWPHAGTGECTGPGDTADLARAEERLNAQVSRGGLRVAVGRAALQGALAFRDDVAPAPLSTLPADTDAAFGPGATARTIGTIFETGADMAVTHGIVQSADGLHRSLYVRVWSRDRRHWQVAVDLRTPLPLP